MFQRLSLPNLQRFAFLNRVFHVMRLLALVIATLGTSFVLGQAMVSPSRETIVSLVVMLVFFVLLIVAPQVGLSIWLVLYPFLGEAIYLDLGAGLPDLTLTRFCVFLLVAILIAQITTQRRPMFKITRVDVAAFIFFITLSVSTLAASDPNGAFKFALDTYFLPLLIYFIARNLIESRQDLELLLSALLILSVYSALYLIYQHTMNSANEVVEGYGARWVQGLLGGPHVFGLVFTTTLPFVVQHYLEARHSIKRALYLALSGLLLVGIFFSFKRGIWLAAVVSFLVMQFLHPRFRRFFLVLLAFAAVGLLFAGDQVSDSSAADRLNDDLATGNGRTFVWEAAIDLWQERPIFGHGLGQFSKLTEYGAAENFYLNMLVSAGVVSLLPFLALVLFVVRDSITVYRQSKRATSPALFVNWEMVAVFLGSATAYLVKAFSGNMAVPLPNILFYLLIGAVIESQISRLSTLKPAATNNMEYKR